MNSKCKNLWKILLFVLIIGMTPVSAATAHAAKNIEASQYFGDYKKLVKKVSGIKYRNSKQDPAGKGKLYVFNNGALFLRYSGKKVTVFQNDQKKNVTLYGLKLGMSTSKMKAQMKKKSWKLKSTQKYSTNSVYQYGKSGHTLKVWIYNGKITVFQWIR